MGVGTHSLRLWRVHRQRHSVRSQHRPVFMGGSHTEPASTGRRPDGPARGPDAVRWLDGDHFCFDFPAFVFSIAPFENG